MAMTLTNLGIAYGNLGDDQKKRELLERSLKIDERQYGPDHPEVVITLMNLGNAYLSLGVTQKARKILEIALTIFRRAADHHQWVETHVRQVFRSVGCHDTLQFWSARTGQLPWST